MSSKSTKSVASGLHIQVAANRIITYNESNWVGGLRGEEGWPEKMNCLREFALCHSRHPGPRHVWKAGSDLPGLRSVPVNPLIRLKGQTRTGDPQKR